jgi:hypothetical protein
MAYGGREVLRRGKLFASTIAMPGRGGRRGI